MSNKITTYKGTSKDLTAHGGFKYEIGKTVTDDGAIRCGNKGFHSCEAPMDVLRYFPMREGNRFFVCEADGIIDRSGANDTKLASSELTIKGEIGIPGIIKAQVEYTRRKAEEGKNGGDRSNLAGGDSSNLAGGVSSNLAGGDWSNLAGGDRSNLAGGFRSNLAGGFRSNLAGGDRSNLAGGDCSNLAGGFRSNLAGGDSSNLAGGDSSNLAGGDWSNLAGGFRSNLAGGFRSNLAGGDRSLIVGRNGCKAKAGKNSFIVLTEWGYVDDEYIPVNVKAAIVDGEILKEDTWYELKDGEFVEVDNG